MTARLRAAMQCRFAQLLAAILRWRIDRISFEYCDLGCDLDFNERAMEKARSRIHLRRIELLIQRQKLQARLDGVGAPE
ncbi:MAG: hypothetical protein H7Z39_04235 [Burkholderiaceae bacterium]|nr:hypothetical protein [Burkholderiaceae bacterium]